MVKSKRARKAERKAQARAAMAARTPAAAAAPALLGDWQRRVILMLLASGLAFGAVGVLVAPRGAGFWVAVAAAPAIGAVLGYTLGGAPGRALEARLMGAGEAPREPPRLPAPAALADPVRAMLQAATVPVLLGELSAAAAGMGPRERAAALALVEAGTTAPEGEARQALGGALPRLIVGLTSGNAASAGEAEAFARRLAQAPSGERGA